MDESALNPGSKKKPETQLLELDGIRCNHDLPRIAGGAEGGDVRRRTQDAMLVRDKGLTLEHAGLASKREQ
jgi:hypothetical protein